MMKMAEDDISSLLDLQSFALRCLTVNGHENSGVIELLLNLSIPNRFQYAANIRAALKLTGLFTVLSEQSERHVWRWLD